MLTEGPVIPILMIACNREPAIRRSLDLLIKHRPSKERFPIIVSQDCGHQPTKQAILSFGDQINLIEVRLFLLIKYNKRFEDIIHSNLGIIIFYLIVI